MKKSREERLKRQEERRQKRRKQEKEQKEHSRFLQRIAIGLAVVGVLFTCRSIYLYTFYEQAEGKIISMTPSSSSSSKSRTYSYTFSFTTVKGQKVIADLPYSTAENIPQYPTVLYNADDPQNIDVAGGKWKFPLFFFTMGFFFFFVSLLPKPR